MKSSGSALSAVKKNYASVINRIRSLAKVLTTVSRSVHLIRATNNKLQVSWSMHALTNRSHRQQATGNKLDMKDIMGYSLIKKKEKRTYAKLNASRPRTVVTRRNKPARARNWQPRTRVTNYFSNLNLQAPSSESIKQQASSPKQQALSFKPQASSSKILEPRYM